MSEETEKALERYIRYLEAGSQVTAALAVLMEKNIDKDGVERYVRKTLAAPRPEHVEMLIVIINDMVRDCKLDRSEFVTKMEHMNGQFCEAFTKTMGMGSWDEAGLSFLRSLAPARATTPENNSRNTPNCTQP